MLKTNFLFAVFIISIFTISCRKVKEYFRNPDPESLVETIQSATLTGYAINIAFSAMGGQSFPHVITTRSNGGFPCTSLMIINLEDDDNYAFQTVKASKITVAALWPNANTAIFTLIYTDYHVREAVLDIVGIETIPAVKDENFIHVAIASQEISLNPDQDSFLSIDLTTLEIESELLRLEMTRATDVYVAVEQKAYLVDIDNNGTCSEHTDDLYIITGGGQLIEVAGNSAEIVQQAMVEVKVSMDCALNPTEGMALIKVTGLEEEDFPELGTAVLDFPNRCNGSAHVFAATGMFISSNGKTIPFEL